MAAHDLMKAQVKVAQDINNEKKKALTTLKLDTMEVLGNWKSSVFDMEVIYLDDECSFREYVDKVIFLCPTDSFVADYETKERNKVQAGQAKVGDSAFTFH